MAHQIENNEIAGVRPFWHGLGTQVQPGATGEEMQVAAKLKWPVEMREIAFMLPGRNRGIDRPPA